MTSRIPPISPCLLAALTLFGLPLMAADSPEALRFFEMKVRPLLANECFECHGTEKHKGGLRLDHLDFILKGGETGPALVSGKPEESLMVEAIRRSNEELEMPPKKTLDPEQVEVIEKWVAMGAPWPAETAEKGETDEHGFSAKDRNWWAIQAIQDPAVPKAGEGWAKNEIDRFIAAKYTEKGLAPAPQADAHELIRRMYFDMHGLPPAPQDVELFVDAYAKNADQATADLADRLLASPRYGERWGQHWLDVVRYAESDGYRADAFRPDAWRYRDYVIRSFNEDKPYRDFVREQLAGDELTPEDPDKLIGTAFLRLGIYEWNQRNARMQWELILTEMTNVTSEAFLGISMGCAECHDHKFDPILQKDYFALQAFLNSTWWPEHDELATPEQRAERDAQLARWEAATKEIRAEMAAMEKPILDSRTEATVQQFPEDVQALYWKKPGTRTAYEEQLVKLVQRQVDLAYGRTDFKKVFASDARKQKRYNELQEALAKFDSLKPAALPTAFITTDVGKAPADTILKRRGKEEIIQPAFLTLLGDEAPKIQATPQGTTGRRTALANWLTNEKNPFPARVMTNRLWQKHFGTGLVSSPNDFGLLGDPPSHPELFDWLTTRFLESGWRMKGLHKMILTSATYRQTARREPTQLEDSIDSANRLLWRYPPMRLDAEQIRDAALAVSGELKTKDGGPSVEGSDPSRSIYMKKRRNSPDPLIGEFDSPEGFNSMPSRVTTTTASQSLLLVNGPWSMGRAKAFAQRILGGSNSFSATQVREAYRLAYGRDPDESEIAAAQDFVETEMLDNTKAGKGNVEDKYAGETGLRPITQFFDGIPDIKLGDKALWLQPGSRFERLDLSAWEIPDENFTIETVTILDNVHSDASVNTLISRWNGSSEDIGWSLGVTSAKSSFSPRNLILQVVGDDFQKNRVYEVVASGLRVPIGKPVYIAAVVSARPSKEDVGKGKVIFYLKDLSDPKAPLQTASVQTEVVGGLAVKAGVATLLGGRDQSGHLWDGQVARIAMSDVLLNKEQLFVNDDKDSAKSSLSPVHRIFDRTLTGNDELSPIAGTSWKREVSKDKVPASSPALVAAVVDFCQALLNSNEFLYLQ